jgi:hypothetical protein
VYLGGAGAGGRVLLGAVPAALGTYGAGFGLAGGLVVGGAVDEVDGAVDEVGGVVVEVGGVVVDVGGVVVEVGGVVVEVGGVVVEVGGVVVEVGGVVVELGSGRVLLVVDDPLVEDVVVLSPVPGAASVPLPAGSGS